MSNTLADLSTAPVTTPAALLPVVIELVVISGPDKGTTLSLKRGRYLLGKASACDMVLTDPGVSRRHLEVTRYANALRLRDLSSSNGSFFHGARFECVDVGVGANIQLGNTILRVQLPRPEGDEPHFFGALRGHSAAMKNVFRLLRRAAPTGLPVLLQGETGTGKELAARAVHEASGRGELLICDLGAISPTLIDSELFGHARGAFTGAVSARAGAFERAHGGTLFLDEVGELDISLQPRLLRAIETGQVKRLGESHYRRVDVRIIAATNRDLHVDVTTGRFRSDLYHRLAVFCVSLPPLRERRHDIPILVQHFRSQCDTNTSAPIDQTIMDVLVEHDWPGNVRQLRNVIERALALAETDSAIDADLLGLHEHDGNHGEEILPLKEAKGQLIAAWERDYVEALIHRCGGNVTAAARRAGVSRMHLHRLLRKYGTTP